MYRSLVMMDSASSSISSSAALMSASIWERTDSPSFNCSKTLSSRSNSLMAYHRCCSSGSPCTAASSIWARACSTVPEKVCMGTVFSFFAASIAASAASMIPFPFRAEISITLHPRALDNSSVLILSPFFSTTSIMLMATTTGIPSSVSWVVKYRFLSRFVPSMIFKIASGRSLIR